MFPPTMVCNPAPIVPTMERERTTIPRTIPRLRFTRKPGNSNAVVTFSCGTMPASYAAVNLDHRFILDEDRFLQPVANSIAAGAVDAALRRITTHDYRPFFLQQQIRPVDGGQPGQAVIDCEGFAQRDA